MAEFVELQVNIGGHLNTKFYSFVHSPNGRHLNRTWPMSFQSSKGDRTEA